MVPRSIRGSTTSASDCVSVYRCWLSLAISYAGVFVVIMIVAFAGLDVARQPCSPPTGRNRGGTGRCPVIPPLLSVGNWVPGCGPWIQRLANPPARVQVPRQRPGWSSGIQGAAARPIAGWRSSSPPPSGGAGTTGTGAVRDRTRRPTSPAAAGGRDQQSRGQGSPWLPYPVRPGGLGVHHLVRDDSGAL